MRIDKVISLASRDRRLPFLAMERSLRATGCDLPLWVIPHGEDVFDLPKGSHWWTERAVVDWLASVGAHPRMRKYQSLTVGNYQFADTDVIFLRNPEDVLEPYSGLVSACTEWNKPENTYTFKSRLVMSRRSSTFLKTVFNSGQFACDRPLYPSVDSLKETAMRREFRQTCIRYPADQPGVNLLAFESGVPVTNLTLPPICMESTWAGDYPKDYERLWSAPDRKPLLIHWAGRVLERDLPINQLFYQYLTRDERAEWDGHVRAERLKLAKWPLGVRIVNRGLRWWYRRYRVYRAW